MKSLIFILMTFTSLCAVDAVDGGSYRMIVMWPYIDAGSPKVASLVNMVDIQSDKNKITIVPKNSFKISNAADFSGLKQVILKVGDSITGGGYVIDEKGKLRGLNMELSKRVDGIWYGSGMVFFPDDRDYIEILLIPVTEKVSGF